MPFLRQSIVAAVLVTLTLLLQSAGMATLIEWGRAHDKRHISQILLWAEFFRWKCFPSWESAFYFSTTSYSTVGYGDLVLPSSWRLLGRIEAVTGVLMCGLSAGFLFAIVTRLVEHESQLEPALAKRPAVLSVPGPFLSV
jgi:voltage-gated potassium channel